MNASFLQSAMPAAALDLRTDHPGLSDREPGISFYHYMQREMDDAYGVEKNLLGVRPGAGGMGIPASNDSDGRMPAGFRDEALRLSQLMEGLREAAESADAGPGEWLALITPGQLEKIAADAGMDETGLSRLLEKLNDDDGGLRLNDFFNALAANFTEMGKVKPVTVPETDLPLLETVLAKMGVPVEVIDSISSKALNKDGQVDLSVLVEGLKDVSADPIILSDIEVDGLQDLLSRAGASEDLQKALLWERDIPFQKLLAGAGLPEALQKLTSWRKDAPWLRQEVECPAVNFSIGRLRDMLGRALTDIKADRNKGDLPAFFNDLKQILAEGTLFEHKGVKFTPVLQKSIDELRDKLTGLVDLATVKVRNGNGNMRTAGMSKSVSTTPEHQEGAEAPFVEDGLETQSEKIKFAGKQSDILAARNILKSVDKPGAGQVIHLDHRPSSGAPAAQNTLINPGPEAAVEKMNGGGTMPVDNLREPAAKHLPAQLEQQVFARISQGVVNGLRNNTHHLVLDLYPPDLGKVKVELMVRHEQVSVSFAMENSKVKELMDSNMQQFRDNLTKQGFVMGECMVSVGQHDGSGSGWQGFGFAWQGQGHAERESGFRPAAEVLYGTPDFEDGGGRREGINMIV